MKIEQMSAINKMAKAIYNKEERLVNDKEKLFLTHKINKNSFADFYRAFQKMFDGEHTRGISTDLRDYFCLKYHCCPEKFYHSVSCLGPSPSGTLAVRLV